MSIDLFVLESVLIPISLIFALPKIVKSFGGHLHKHQALLYVAGILFFISWYLPSPLIDGVDTSFTTHFIGGGLFTGFIWLYLKRSFAWRSNIILESASLFSLVSALGAVNELAELFMVKLSIAAIQITDTNWDILANTLGAAVFFSVLLAINRLKKSMQ